MGAYALDAVATRSVLLQIAIPIWLEGFRQSFACGSHFAMDQHLATFFRHDAGFEKPERRRSGQCRHAVWTFEFPRCYFEEEGSFLGGQFKLGRDLCVEPSLRTAVQAIQLFGS